MEKKIVTLIKKYQNSADDRESFDVLLELGKLNNIKSEEFLLNVLKSSEIDLRRNAASLALSDMKSKVGYYTTIDVLKNMLKEEKSTDKLFDKDTLVYSLGEYGFDNSDIVDFIVELFIDGYFSVRLESINLMKNIERNAISSMKAINIIHKVNDAIKATNIEQERGQLKSLLQELIRIAGI